MTQTIILSPAQAQALKSRPNRDLSELRREPPDFWAAKFNCALYDLTHFGQERHFRNCKSFLREYQYATGAPDAERADELLRECQAFVETPATAPHDPNADYPDDMMALMRDPKRRLGYMRYKELQCGINLHVDELEAELAAFRTDPVSDSEVTELDAVWQKRRRDELDELKIAPEHFQKRRLM